MKNVQKISLKISLKIQSQMSTDIQYIVEGIQIMADNHLLKTSATQTLILTIVRSCHIRPCWAKHTMLILMLSSAVLWRASNTFAIMSIKAVRWRCLEWKIWMYTHKHSLEALNRTLKDIKNNDKLFGGTRLVLSGDFRQTLPVIPRSTYAMKSTPT